LIKMSRLCAMRYLETTNAETGGRAVEIDLTSAGSMKQAREKVRMTIARRHLLRGIMVSIKLADPTLWESVGDLDCMYIIGFIRRRPVLALWYISDIS